MNLCQRLIITAIIITGISSVFAQDIYVYPNMKLCDQSLLEYRRYTLEEAQAYDEGGSFDPYTTLSWGPERRLTQQDFVYRSRVVVSGDSLYVAYQRIWGRQAYFIRSLNGGTDWEDYQTLVDSGHDYSYTFPEIVRNGSDLLMSMSIQEAPYGNNLGYFRSTDYGASWGDLLRAFPYMSNEIGYTSLCNVGGMVYGSFNDGFNRDSIYVLRSTDWGDSWNGRGINVAHLTNTPQPMTVRAWENNVYLVWVNENQPISCRYSRSTDRGLTWSDEIEISNDSLGAQRVFLSVQDSHVIVCWRGYKYSPYSFTGDLFLKQSFDSGETWGEEQVLTDLHEVRLGTVYSEDSLISAVWTDARFGGGNDEIYVRTTYDYGMTWTDEERLSYGDNHSYEPISCKTGDKIHVFWGDIRSDTPGLYYCADDLSTAVKEAEISHPTNIYISSYPNPFNAHTLITFSGIEGGDINIYDVTGRLIKSITVTGKEGNVIWDATDDRGNHVSSGIYFIRAWTSYGYASNKVIFLK